MGATDGQMTRLLGSYSGLRSERSTAGRLRCDQRLAHFCDSCRFWRSHSLLPRKVPERENEK